MIMHNPIQAAVPRLDISGLDITDLIACAWLTFHRGLNPRGETGTCTLYLLRGVS